MRPGHAPSGRPALHLRAPRTAGALTTPDLPRPTKQVVLNAPRTNTSFVTNNRTTTQADATILARSRGQGATAGPCERDTHASTNPPRTPHPRREEPTNGTTLLRKRYLCWKYAIHRLRNVCSFVDDSLFAAEEDCLDVGTVEGAPPLSPGCLSRVYAPCGARGGSRRTPPFMSLAY